MGWHSCLTRCPFLGPGGAWSGWASLGAPPNAACAAFSGQPCDVPVAQNSNGRLQIFVNSTTTFTDGVVNTQWQLSPGGAWSGWYSLGAPPSPGAQSDPAVAQNLDGRLEVFVLGINNNTYHKSQVSAGSPRLVRLGQFGRREGEQPSSRSARFIRDSGRLCRH